MSEGRGTGLFPQIERGFTWSEEYRHQCEVRLVLRKRIEDRNEAFKYLGKVKEKRGDEAAGKLERDVRDQWSKGNRGEEASWK